MVAGTTGTGAGTLKGLGDTIFGLSIGFTGVMGVARTDGEKTGEILPLSKTIHKNSKCHAMKISLTWDPKQSHLPHLHPYLQHLPPY